MFCKNCGANVDSNFCTNCGAKIGNDSTNNAVTNDTANPRIARNTSSNRNKKPHDWATIIGITIGVIVLIARMGAGFSASRAGAERQATESTTSIVEHTTDASTETSDVSSVTDKEASAALSVSQEPLDANQSQDSTATEEDTSIQERSESEKLIAEDSTNWTREQENAYKAAKRYLNYTAFSKQGLIDQLSSEYGDQYPTDVATFAVEQLEERGEVDWFEQAERSAKHYLSYMEFSRQELIDQLSSEYGEQFTVEQAEAAVEKVY